MFRVEFRYNNNEEWISDTLFETLEEAIQYMYDMKKVHGVGGTGMYIPHRLVIRF